MPAPLIANSCLVCEVGLMVHVCTALWVSCGDEVLSRVLEQHASHGECKHHVVPNRVFWALWCSPRLSGAHQWRSGELHELVGHHTMDILTEWHVLAIDLFLSSSQLSKPNNICSGMLWCSPRLSGAHQWRSGELHELVGRRTMDILTEWHVLAIDLFLSPSQLSKPNNICQKLTHLLEVWLCILLNKISPAVNIDNRLCQVIALWNCGQGDVTSTK